MSFSAECAPDRWKLGLAAGLLIAASLVGCNKSPTGNEKLEKAIAADPQHLKKENVAQFAGKVTIDGQPPSKEWKVFVILTNPQHLDENAHSDRPKLYAGCDEQGHFAFGTYDRDDGVVAGKYVVTFVELHVPGLAQVTTQGRFKAPVGQVGARKAYTGPDELKNLYNDPDKNQKEEKFSLDLQPPGKADYDFDLAVAGKDTAAPGPNAVTKIAGAH